MKNTRDERSHHGAQKLVVTCKSPYTFVKSQEIKDYDTKNNVKRGKHHPRFNIVLRDA